MQKLLEWMGCKEKEIISKIEEGRQNGICDFVDIDDPIELNSFCFIEYIKRIGKVMMILIATRKYCLHCKNNGVNIDSEGKVGIVLNGLKSIPIKDHIDYLNSERRERLEISPVPEKEELRKLFARAIACLGRIVRWYLFSWDDVPGNDSGRLLRYLRTDHDIDWAGNAEISKSDDGKTIRIIKDENSAEIMINEKEEKATLTISDGRTHNLKVKRENNKLNIYVRCF